MKQFFFGLFLFVGVSQVFGSVGPQPYSWSKVISCDNDSLVVDTGVGDLGRLCYQFVLRGEALDLFLSRNAIPTYDLVEGGRAAAIPLTRELSHDGYYYYGSVYMKTGEPGTVAYFDVVPSANGMIVKFNQRGSNYTEYEFRNCRFLRAP